MRKMLTVAAAVVWAGLGAASLSAEENADLPDARRIQGAWKQEAKIEKGVETKIDESEENQLTLRVTFEEQDLKVLLGPKGAPIEIAGSYYLDPAQTPKLIDVTIKGADGSNEVHAIYKFEKDRLYLRVRNGGGQRPIDFDTPEDDCSTIILRRLKEGE